MTDALSGERLADLNLSHAFINTLSSSYQGMYVYENVFGILTQSPERERKMADTAQVLDKVNEWWRLFKRHEPLVRHGCRDEGMTGDGARAWRLLEVSQRRIESLAEQMLSTTSVEALLEDPEARCKRVAAFCDSAYARHHFVYGLVAYGEILGREQVADRWRQHLPSTLRETGRGTELFGKFRELGEQVDEDSAEHLLDVTLVLPVILIRQAVDIRGVFGLLRDRFDYLDAGIPSDQVERWQALGFTPGDAGHWRATGLSPEESLEWIKAGVPDPTTAATFAWRNIAMDVAAKWHQAGCNGRAAAFYLARGITDPDRIPRDA
jgi:hypothetical protein